MNGRVLCAALPLWLVGLASAESTPNAEPPASADVSPIVLTCARHALPQPLSAFLDAHQDELLQAAAEETIVGGHVVYLDVGATGPSVEARRRAVRSFPQAEHAARRWSNRRGLDPHGRLPWMLVERYDAVSRVMRSQDRAVLAVEVGRCLRLAGATAFPFNLTAPDGHVLPATLSWAQGEGPHEGGTHRTVAHRLQGRLLEKLHDRLRFECRVWPGLVQRIDNPTEAVFAALADTYNLADTLAEVDVGTMAALHVHGAADFLAASEQYYASVEDQARLVFEQRLEAASCLFASLVYTAWLDAGAPDLGGTSTAGASKPDKEGLQKTAPFVGSRSSSVYHRATCSHARRIKAANRVEFQTPEEARAAGRSPCRVCKPEEPSS